MPKGGYRETPAYDMNEDGFTLLAMGFTGKKATQWKIAYMRAFKAMRAELQKSSRPSLPSLTPSTAGDRGLSGGRGSEGYLLAHIAACIIFRQATLVFF